MPRRRPRRRRLPHLPRPERPNASPRRWRATWPAPSGAASGRCAAWTASSSRSRTWRSGCESRGRRRVQPSRRARRRWSSATASRASATSCARGSRRAPPPRWRALPGRSRKPGAGSAPSRPTSRRHARAPRRSRRGCAPSSTRVRHGRRRRPRRRRASPAPTGACPSSAPSSTSRFDAGTAACSATPSRRPIGSPRTGATRVCARFRSRGSRTTTASASPPPDPRPLAGVVVVDLTRVLAGPYCTLVLANLGARVIKVERPPAGDEARGIGPFVGGTSLYFAALNHGKESIALDLRAPDDRAIFERLLAAGDVLVENFRPGVLERLGYGWPALHARWPRLVYAATSGFGQTGPLRDRPAFDLVVQAMGGILSLTGYPDGPPARVGVSIGDLAAGLFTTIGILAALGKRRETGRGTMVDVAMLDCQLAILENALTTHLATGAVPGRLGTRHPNIAPFQAFTAGDGALLVICAGHDAHFAALCEAIGRPELSVFAHSATT